MRLTKRGKRYYCEIDTPVSVAHLDTRKRVSIALKTDSLAVARAKAVTVETEIRAYWQALADGRSTDAEDRFLAAKSVAHYFGFPYRTTAQIAAGDLSELIDRVEALEGGEQPTLTHVEALLGTAKRPEVRISSALDEYIKHNRTTLAKKSERQRHRWEVMRRRAIKNFIDVVGDKPVEEIARDDALNFRDWWSDRLENDGLTPDSPNKDLQNLSSIFQLVADRLRLDVENPFRGLRFKDDEDRRPPPFERDWIVQKVFPALNALEADERAIMQLLAELGLRPSEACNLLPGHIHLGDDVPHIEIATRSDRQLKTRHAKRKLPLVGASLTAMHAHPEGFPRFRDLEPSFCTSMNRWLTDEGLRPTPKHVIYSFRHGFADRLRAVECPIWLQDSLMGHAPKGENYGDGAKLDQARDWLSRVALVAS